MPPADPWLKRQNAALRMRGCDVSLDVAGARIRLRATVPPRPGDPPGSPDRQQRISTGLAYPEQAAEAVELADALGKALERHRVGLEPFNWTPWLRLPSLKDASVAALKQISGAEAVALAREWWFRHGKHRHAAEQTWSREYERQLRPLLSIPALQSSHIKALVERTPPRSRTRRGQVTACVVVARALGWPKEMIDELLESGRGYTKGSATRRDLPSDATIEAAIDQLSPGWQWAVGMVATYGCRPHEALLYAEVLPSGVAMIEGGKTGARQSLALPARWIDRWELKSKRLPRIDCGRGNVLVGQAMGKKFHEIKIGFKAYDLRHAWAVRAICDPRISPSLAAKSMGHSLTMHSAIYQRWFDGSELENVQSLLSAAS